jgi:hypothetical protein
MAECDCNLATAARRLHDACKRETRADVLACKQACNASKAGQHNHDRLYEARSLRHASVMKGTMSAMYSFCVRQVLMLVAIWIIPRAAHDGMYSSRIGLSVVNKFRSLMYWSQVQVQYIPRPMKANCSDQTAGGRPDEVCRHVHMQPECMCNC